MTNQQLLDELRGELDREHNVGLDWSGPVTDDYLRGYGDHDPQQTAARESATYAEAHYEHGWY